MPRPARPCACWRHQALFDDERLSAFVVVRDPATAASARDMRGLRWFLDLDGAVSRLYDALDADGVENPMWLLLDPTLRVMGRVQLSNAQMIFDMLPRLAPPDPCRRRFTRRC